MDKQVETELRGLVDELRSVVTERTIPGEQPDALTKEHLDRLNARISELEAEQAKSRRPAVELPEQPVDMDMKDAERALERYIRRGDQRMSAEDRDVLERLEKAMSVDSQQDGGYTVTPAFSNRIVTLLHDTSPMRSLATVETITSDALEGLYDGDDAAAGWVAESGARPETDSPEIGQWRVPTHELYARPKATQKLLDDSGIDIAAWLQGKIAQRFALIENAAFVNGTGVGMPRGFTTYPDGTNRGQIERIPSGSATGIEADAIFDLVYALKSAYRQGATFVMNRATLGAVRGLREGSGGDGAFMWQPGLGGTPSTLAGYPVVEFDDMDDISASNIVMGFGNFALAYTIVDRQGVRVLRDPYSSKPFVEFYTTKRVGGDVVLHDAIKLMDIAAS